ncbi:hypothetical protein [Actinoplanes sp. NBRC 103695]|uniref:hypothetical protein n=1 Tax=Actinoplanes sp. NBRC 103695 TaxID=3032202 RepID=UPI0024A1E7F7|nr:hypothetical protein [Actinoplanes sp. NBRC 103695]GLZ00840.1 hypothetical protein Acsp02_80920 [Actinoplanes sp. NBRC 103695]
MAFWRRRKASFPVDELLRRRVEDCVDRRNAGPALEGQALVDTSQAIDALLLQRHQGAVLPIGVLADVIVVHRLRATGLASADDAHAYVALAVWMHAVNGGEVAPQLRHEVDDAIARGAETDEPIALLRALQGHAAAVRSHWLKTQDPALADIVVAVFVRLLDHTTDDDSAYATRLLDLAGVTASRTRFMPSAAASDLDDAINFAERALRHPRITQAAIRRAHQLLGPLLVTRLERDGARTDYDQAETSFSALVDLAVDETEREQCQRDVIVLRQQYEHWGQ